MVHKHMDQSYALHVLTHLLAMNFDHEDTYYITTKITKEENKEYGYEL